MSMLTPNGRKMFLSLSTRTKLFLWVAKILGMESAVDWKWLSYVRDYHRRK